MNKTVAIALAGVCASLLVGCSTLAPVVNVGGHRAAVVLPSGYIFSLVSAPVASEVTGKPAGSKVGQASAHYIAIPLWFLSSLQTIPIVSWGDATEKTAMENAGITDVTDSGIDWRSYAARDSLAASMDDVRARTPCRLAKGLSPSTFVSREFRAPDAGFPVCRSGTR